MNRTRALLGALVASSLLCGCVALPIPVKLPSGPVEGSRPDVSTSLADQVIAGRTTRTEVLLALGEPDGRGDADRWFSYGSRIGRGGLGWLLFVGVGAGYGGGFSDLFQLGAWETSHRAIIHFGDDGAVSNVDFEEKKCSDDCLDIGGTKIKAAEDIVHERGTFEQLTMTAGSILGWYTGYAWTGTTGPGCTYPLFFSDKTMDLLGELVITERGIFWRQHYGAGDPSDEPGFLAFADLSDVKELSSHALMSWIPLQKRDGSCVFLHVGQLNKSGPAMQEAHELILKGVAAAAVPGQEGTTQTSDHANEN